MAVNKLRTNSDKAVSDMAKEIVAKWKQDVHQKAKPAKPRATTSPITSAHPAADPPKPSGKKSDSKVDPSKRNIRTDGIDSNVTGDKTRDSCVGMLYNGLCLDSDVAPERVLALAKSLEQEVFVNHKKKIESQYKRRIQTLFLNLKDKKNPDLRRRVIQGEITTARLATMETKEMASEERRREDEALEKENMRNSMIPKAQRSISDQLTCGKCNQKRVSYSQAQTRSADEPMTTFCTCEACGNMWKVFCRAFPPKPRLLTRNHLVFMILPSTMSPETPGTSLTVLPTCPTTC